MKLMTPFSLPSIRRWAGCLLLLSAALLPQAKAANDFVTTGSPSVEGPRTTTLLANGKVLVVGEGYDSDGNSIPRAELYDPATGQWSATGSPSNTFSGQCTVTLLANGKVLVVGNGYDSEGHAIPPRAELYDTATGQWSATGSPSIAFRDGGPRTATLLANGKVLVVGNSHDSDWNTISGAELYDPATGQWSAAGSPFTEIRYYYQSTSFTATLLANGKVLALRLLRGSEMISSAELYDPATGQWSATGLPLKLRNYPMNPSFTVTLLANGKVLVTVTGDNDGINPSAELYDPATGQWSATGSPSGDPLTATLLTNGKVLIMGIGYESDGNSIPRAELYDPATGQWNATGSPSIVLNKWVLPTAILLTNGKVLVMGTGYDSDGNSIPRTELYQSDSLFSGDYVYSVLNGAATLDAYRGAGGAVTIPSTIGGFSVTSIAYGAFYGCVGLTSVTIPSSVDSIGNQAFAGCSGLTRVSLPERFLTDIVSIGLSGQVAATTLIDGIANNLSTNTTFINALAGNDAFVTAVANKIKSTSGNYGIATQSVLSSALTESRADGINSVLSNPSLWTLYTTSQIQNMAVGDLVLTKNVQGTYTLNYDIEQSSDLKTWTPYQALTLPLTGLPTDKAFVRIKVKP